MKARLTVVKDYPALCEKVARSILDLAKKYLSEKHSEFEKFLARFERDTREASRARKEAEKQLREAEQAKKEIDEKTRTVIRELMTESRQKLHHVMAETQEEVRRYLNELQKKKFFHDAEPMRHSLHKMFSRASSELQGAVPAGRLGDGFPEISIPEADEEAKRAVQMGDWVRIPKWKKFGRILEINEKKVKVSVGSASVSLSLSDIELLSAEQQAVMEPSEGTADVRVQIEKDAVLDVLPSALDLRGIRYEDAMSNFERYLDRAYRSGLTEVRIIHGVGTGALKEGVRNILNGLPYVKGFRDGGSGQGGAGVTVVEFDYK